MKTLKAIATLPLALLALTQCSGDAQDGGGKVSSGIPSGKALSAVTTQEAVHGCEQLNADITAHFNRASARTGLCTLVGLALSQDEASCTSQRDACLKDYDSSDASFADPSQSFTCSDANVDGWQGCSATVGDMEACLNELLAAFDSTLSSYSCKDAGRAPATDEDCGRAPIDPTTGMPAIDPTTGQPYVDGPECEASPSSLMSPATPSSCQALQTQCPQLQLFALDD